jgi:hypothetical protein
MDIAKQMEIIEGLRELKIDVVRFPVKNVEKDLIAINREGIDNLEIIEKWEKLKKKMERVI